MAESAKTRIRKLKCIVLTPITRKYIHSLHGKYKGKGLLKALMEEKSAEKIKTLDHETREKAR